MFVKYRCDGGCGFTLVVPQEQSTDEPLRRCPGCDVGVLVLEKEEDAEDTEAGASD